MRFQIGPRLGYATLLEILTLRDTRRLAALHIGGHTERGLGLASQYHLYSSIPDSTTLHIQARYTSICSGADDPSDPASGSSSERDNYLLIIPCVHTYI